MSNMEKLLSEIATEITTVQNKPLWISKIDLAYACGQRKFSEETSRHCNIAITGNNKNGYYRFKKGFYGLPIFEQNFKY